MNSSETAVQPATGNPDNHASSQAMKISKAVRNCVSQAEAFCNSAVASNCDGDMPLQTERVVANSETNEESCQESSSATAVGNENVLTTAGAHAQIFNFVNTYHNTNASSSTQNETPAPMQVENSPRAPQASYPHVHYNEQVLWCVVENLTDHQRLKIKMLLRKESTTGIGIPRQELENIQTNTDLINCLEDHNLLSVHNTWFLQFLAFCVRNKKIYKRITEFMADRMIQEHPVCVYEPLAIKGGVQVQLKVAGDIERFTKMDIETFRQILAENCGNKVRYTNLTGINDGCVELTFQIPTSCKDILVKDARNCAEWLVGNGVMKVTFMDDATSVDLQHLEADISHQSMISESTQLLTAILKGNPENTSVSSSDSPVPALLGATPHTQNFNRRVAGKPLLHWACELSKRDWVQFLIRHGADINARDELGLTIFHKVAFLDLVDVCQDLLKFDEIDLSHLTAKDEDGLKPVEYAYEAVHKDIARLLESATLAAMEQDLQNKQKKEEEDKRREQIMSEQIIQAFMTEFVQKRGVHIEGVSTTCALEEHKLMHPSPDVSIGRQLHMIGDELHARHEMKFRDMIRQLDTDDLSNVATYREIARRMFRDGDITWGRIVELMTFSAHLVVHSAKRGSKDVPKMIGAAAKNISEIYGPWIMKNREGYLEEEKTQEDDQEKPLSSLAAAVASIAAWNEQSY